MSDTLFVGTYLISAVGLLALLAVFIFWGGSNSSAALPYFAVPGVLFAVSGALGYRALRSELRH
jgi:hypothetical protein